MKGACKDCKKWKKFEGFLEYICLKEFALWIFITPELRNKHAEIERPCFEGVAI